MPNNNKPLQLFYLRILESIIYIFIYKEKQELKSEKLVPRVLSSKLVRFNGHTIYHMHIEKQKRVIKVKDLRIFEDTEIKETTILSDYKSDKPIF